MILYQLCCSKDHTFEAWFRNSETFDKQAKRGAVSCPQCGDTKVRKAIMAPRIAKGAAEAPPPAASAAPAAPSAMHAMSPEIRRALLALRKHVEDNCDYVGENFAEEARRIHYGEGEKRGIYGETSDAEAEALAEEGIEFGRVPWLPRGN